MSFLPQPSLYYRVCSQGLRAIRPLDDAAQPDSFGWDFGAIRAPSYLAAGRLRALSTLQHARSLLHRPSRVLEIAAGDGALCACLAGDGHDVTANDLRAENLRAAISRFRTGKHVRIWPGNVFDLEARGDFDLVLACEIIEHVAHPMEFVQQLGRFLGPNGKILITTPNGAYFRNDLPTLSEIKDFNALEPFQFKPDADGHLFLITPAEMRKMVVNCGLHVESLTLWGTPFITGESGFRIFAHVLPLPTCYSFERIAAHAPEQVLEKAAKLMSVVVSAQPTITS